MGHNKNLCIEASLFVRRQFNRWGLISNTKLGPGGHGRKPPSSRLGTFYSAYRQWVMTQIHLLGLVLFVRRQFKHWGSISNTMLGPSGHGKKSPSSRLGILYSAYRQWVMTKIHVLRLVLFVPSEPLEPLYEPHACLAISGHSSSSATIWTTCKAM